MARTTAKEAARRSKALHNLKWGVFFAFFMSRHVFSPLSGRHTNVHCFFAVATVPPNLPLQKATAAAVKLSSEEAVATGAGKKDYSSLPLSENDTLLSKDKTVVSASPTARSSGGDTIANSSLMASFLFATSRLIPPRFIPSSFSSLASSFSPSTSFSSSSLPFSSGNRPQKEKNASAVKTCSTTAGDDRGKGAPLEPAFNRYDNQIKAHINNTPFRSRHRHPLPPSASKTLSSFGPSPFPKGSASPSAFSFLTPSSRFPNTSVFPAAIHANAPLGPPLASTSPSAPYIVPSAATALSTSGISSLSAAASPAATSISGATVAPRFASSSSWKFPASFSPFSTMALLAVRRTAAALRHTTPLTKQAANRSAASHISTAEKSFSTKSLPPSHITKLPRRPSSWTLDPTQRQHSSQQHYSSLQQQQHQKLQQSHLRVLLQTSHTAHENDQRQQQQTHHHTEISPPQHVKQQPHHPEAGMIRFIGHSFFGEDESPRRFSAEEIATMPNCTFYSIYPGSCIPDSPQSPCKYCRAKQFHGGYGATQCPSAASFPEGFQSKYQWRMTPQGRRRIQWVMHEWVCIVEEIPAAVRASLRQQQQRAKAAAAAANAALLAAAGGLGIRPALALQSGYSSATSLPFMGYPSLAASTPQGRAAAAPGQGLRIAIRSAANAVTAKLHATVLFVIALLAGLHSPLL